MKTTANHALPPELLASLESMGELQRFEAGELLIQEGEVSDHLYILLSGQLKVFTLSAKGRELVYNTLHPGESFGELALDGHPRSASVRAMLASQCVVIAGDTLRDLAKTNPDFLFHLFVKVMGLLRRATQKLKSLALDDVYERILALVEEEAVQTDEIRHLPRTLTQQEIANRIGSSREMVNHVFRDLARGGFVVKDPHHGLVIEKTLPKHW